MQHFIEVINPQGRRLELGPYASLDEANEARERASRSPTMSRYYLGEIGTKK